MVLGLSFRLCKMGLKMLSRLSQESKDGAWERNLLHGHVGVLWLGIRDDQEPVVTDPGEEASWAIRDSDTRLRNRTSRQGDGSHGRGVSRAGKGIAAARGKICRGMVGERPVEQRMKIKLKIGAERALSVLKKRRR